MGYGNAVPNLHPRGHWAARGCAGLDQVMHGQPEGSPSMAPATAHSARAIMKMAALPQSAAPTTYF